MYFVRSNFDFIYRKIALFFICVSIFIGSYFDFSRIFSFPKLVQAPDVWSWNLLIIYLLLNSVKVRKQATEQFSIEYAFIKQTGESHWLRQCFSTLRVQWPPYRDHHFLWTPCYQGKVYLILTLLRFYFIGYTGWWLWTKTFGWK